MVDPESTKSIVPEGPELIDAIGLVLKDHDGPVILANVTEKLKVDHPTWTLPERRVKKFIKKYESDKKQSAVEDKRAKMFSSPSKSIRRLFSSKSKKKVTEEADTDSEPVVEETPVEEPVVEEEPPAEEPPAEDPVYVTENESVESPNDCFAPCAIM